MAIRPVCDMCGNTNVEIKFIPKDETWKAKNTEDEFVYSDFEGFYVTKAKKNYLFMECKTCGFRWREKTLYERKLISGISNDDYESIEKQLEKMEKGC